jgi:FkbM family methyltransferase
MWVYIHARTVARVWPRVKRPVRDCSRAVEQVLRGAIESRESFSILQVGAYDGISNDPLHALIRAYPHVRAVLLEPQPGPYAALEALWRDCSRVTPLRCALADTCGQRPLYVIGDDCKSQHPFADQIASFSRSHVETECSRYIWRPSRDSIASVSVPTVDWRTLAKEHGPFDLVTIDVEGYDGDVLHQMDLSTTRPDIILYEHRHLTRDMRRRAARVLELAGYVVRQVNKADSLAIGPGLVLDDG